MRFGNGIKAIASAAILVLPLVVFAQSQSESVRKFGAPVTVKKAVSVAKVQKSPAKFAGKTLRIEGTVKAVCQGMGCWVEVEGPGGASFIARSLDESVLLPKDCAGSRVSVQGVMTAMQAKGHAAAEHKEMEEGHTCPAPDYVLATQGVELYAKR